MAGLEAMLVGLGQGCWVITAGTFPVGLVGGFSELQHHAHRRHTPTRRGQATGVLDLWSNIAGMSLPILGGLVVEGFDLRALGFLGALWVPLYNLLGVREQPGDYHF